jgi:hypothetical protein
MFIYFLFIFYLYNIMNLFKILDKMLKNKIVLYIVLILAITNVFGYIMSRNHQAAIFFALVAYLCSKFTRNNVVIALLALSATNLLLVIVQGRRVYEAFTEGNEEGKPKEKVEIDEKATKEAAKQAVASDPKIDSEEFTSHIENLNKIDKILTKQEGLVSNLDNIKSMMNRLENINSKLKKK